MSRETSTTKQSTSRDGDAAQSPDLEAEHDPAASRGVSSSMLRAIQRRANGGAATAGVHAAAERGVASPTTALPYAEQIPMA